MNLFKTALLLSFFFLSAANSASAVVDITAYTSRPQETDSTPFTTATGTRTRLGVVALSRDLIRVFGYGSTIRFVKFYPSRGCNPKYIPKGIIFRVEDTTNSRYSRRVDIWTNNLGTALGIGKCKALINIQRRK